MTILNEELKKSLQDGEIVLVSYETEEGVKSILATARRAEGATEASITYIDVEGTATAIISAIQDLDSVVGSTVIEEGKHVAVQVTQTDGLLTNLTLNENDIASASLLGTPDDGADQDTAFGKIAQLVISSSGAIELLDYTDTAVAKKFVKSVSETDGIISVARGSFASSDETVTIGDTADGGIDLGVNIDGASIKQNATTKKLYVDSSAITGYVGENAIEVGAENNSEKKISLKIKTNDGVLTQDANGLASTVVLKSVTPSSTNIKEEYELQGVNGVKLGSDTIKVYKDSSIVEIYLGTTTDSVDSATGVITKNEGDKQSLNYVYLNNAGAYQMTKVDVSSMLIETEFGDGLQIDNHIAKAKVDSSSEEVNVTYDASGVPETTAPVLSVSSNGIKVNNIQNAINAKIGTLDATVGTTTVASGSHVAVQITEADGKLTGVTVTENNIPDDDEVLKSVAAGDGIEVTAFNSNSQTVSAVAVTNDPVIEVTSDGIGTKEDAVFDCGFYAIAEPNP